MRVIEECLSVTQFMLECRKVSIIDIRQEPNRGLQSRRNNLEEELSPFCFYACVSPSARPDPIGTAARLGSTPITRVRAA